MCRDSLQACFSSKSFQSGAKPQVRILGFCRNCIFDRTAQCSKMLKSGPHVCSVCDSQVEGVFEGDEIVSMNGEPPASMTPSLRTLFFGCPDRCSVSTLYHGRSGGAHLVKR